MSSLAETLALARTWCVVEGDVSAVLAQELGDARVIPRLCGEGSFFWPPEGKSVIRDFTVTKSKLLRVEEAQRALLDTFSRPGDMLVCADQVPLTERLADGTTLQVPDLRWGPKASRLSVADTGVACLHLGRRFCALVLSGEGAGVRERLSLFCSS